MTRGVIVLALTFLSGWLTAVVSPSLVSAKQAPGEDCVAVSESEYNIAKAEYRLISSSGVYLQTGQFWQRHHWYCPA